MTKLPRPDVPFNNDVARLVADLSKPTYLYRMNRAQTTGPAEGTDTYKPKTRAALTVLLRSQEEIHNVVMAYASRVQARENNDHAAGVIEGLRIAREAIADSSGEGAWFFETVIENAAKERGVDLDAG